MHVRVTEHDGWDRVEMFTDGDLPLPALSIGRPPGSGELTSTLANGGAQVEFVPCVRVLALFRMSPFLRRRAELEGSGPRCEECEWWRRNQSVSVMPS